MSLFSSPAENFFPTVAPSDVFPHLSRYPPRARSPKRRVSVRFRFKNPVRAADAVGAFSLNDVDYAPRAALFDHPPFLNGGDASEDDAQRSCDVFVSHPVDSQTDACIYSSPLVSSGVSKISANRVSASAVAEHDAGDVFLGDVDDIFCDELLLPNASCNVFVDDEPPELLSDTDSDSDDDAIDNLDFSHSATGAESFFGLRARVFGCNFRTAPAPALPTSAVFMNTAEVVLGIAGGDSGRVLVDSGASIHATPRRELCFDVVPCSVSIAGVGGVAFRCVERGSLVFQPSNDGRAGLLLLYSWMFTFPLSSLLLSSANQSWCARVLLS